MYIDDKALQELEVKAFNKGVDAIADLLMIDLDKKRRLLNSGLSTNNSIDRLAIWRNASLISEFESCINENKKIAKI